MIALVPLLLAFIFLSAALVLRKIRESRKARTLATRASIVSVGVAGIALLLNDDPQLTFSGSLPLGWLPPGLLRVAPLVTATVGLLATGLSPAEGHDGKTQARILALLAIAEAFLGLEQAPVLAVLWAASAAVTWRMLSRWSSNPGEARVFGLYQLASVILFAAGAVLLELAARWQDADYSSYGSVLLLSAIGIREASFPFQSWFPRFVERSPMGLVVAFAGPQLGVYAYLELLGGQALPVAAHELSYFGAATALLGAVLGIVQTNARRAVAYLIVSQTGLIAFGLSTETGLVGAVMNWQILAVATSGYAMLLASLEARRGIRALGAPTGNYAATPRLAVGFLIFGLASVGFPLTLGFIAEDLLVQGTVEQFPILSLCLIVATAINGASVMRAFFYLFMGTSRASGEQDLTQRERRIVGAVLTVVVTLGIVPAVIVDLEMSQEAKAATVEAMQRSGAHALPDGESATKSRRHGSD